VRKILLSCIIVSAAVIGGCHSWSGNTSTAVDIGELPSQSFRQQWYRDLRLDSGERTKGLFLRGDQLFVQTTHNRFYSLDRRSGDVQYVSDVADPATDVKPPLILKDHVVYAAGRMLQFYDQHGRLDRTLTMETPFRSAPVGTDSMIYAGVDHEGGGRLVAIDPTYNNNPIRWQLGTGGGVYGAPVKAGPNQTLVFAGGVDGKVYGVSADRAIVWPGLPGGTFETAGPIFADLKTSGNDLLVASNDTKLYCLDVRTGRIRWTYFAGVPLHQGPEVTAAFVYIFVPGKGLSAINRLDGQIDRAASWTVADAEQFLAEDDTYAYLKTNDNRIVAVEKVTGQVKFESRRTDLATYVSNPASDPKGATIYASTKRGLIMAIAPVLRPGVVGELVLDMRPATHYVAMAQ
jgi:outer membrane protein assembly factor BamB